jgi:hypothetical protein
MSTETDPWFLICSERSGSNLIRAMMDAHSQIYAPIPLHLGRNFWLPLYRYGDLSATENWDRLLEDVVRALAVLAPGRDLELSVEELRANVRERSFKDLYLYIFTKGMLKHRKTRIFIKEIYTYQQLYFLIRYFPNAKFVFQVRDPRDYLASCKKSGDRFDRLPSSLRIWEEDQTRSLEALYALTPKQVFVQRYEDLLEHPELVLRTLCRFLGLEFEAQMLAFNETEAARTAARENPFWQNLAKPLLQNNSGKYRRVLTPTEVDMVELRVGPLMKRFGYAPERESFSALKRAAVELYERRPHDWISKIKSRVDAWGSEEYRARLRKQRQVGNEIRDQGARRAAPVSYPYLAPSDSAPSPRVAEGSAKRREPASRETSGTA